MLGPAATSVTLDGTAFVEHRRSGITRYLTELINAFDSDPSLGVELLTPYRYVSNLHVRGTQRGFRAVPLPRRWRRPVLDRMNRGYGVGKGASKVTHYPLYDRACLEAARAAASVTTVYDFTYEVFPELFGDVSEAVQLKREFIEACDVLVCISEATRRDLLRFHPDLDKPVVVTPLAVSQEFVDPAGAKPRRLPDRYLLHVGNRSEHKNADLLFAAFQRLSANDPELWLVLSGQGLPDEQQRLADLGIAERTLVLRLSDAELPVAYREAAAFVFPSRYEGFGLPVLEAMAAGTPTLVADTPALLEVAGDAAVVFGPDDLDGATAAIDRVLRDRQHADALRQAGRDRIRGFSWHRTASMTATAYHQGAMQA